MKNKKTLNFVPCLIALGGFLLGCTLLETFIKSSEKTAEGYLRCETALLDRTNELVECKRISCTEKKTSELEEKVASLKECVAEGRSKAKILKKKIKVKAAELQEED